LRIPKPALEEGYTPITSRDDPDDVNTQMEFGILRLAPNENYQIPFELEKALLLMKGDAYFVWGCPGEELSEGHAERHSLFDEGPWCMHAPAGAQVAVTAGDEGAELAVMLTENETTFPATLFSPDDCRSERRGEGTMRETSTRIVRTIFDHDTRPDANLVLGEVVDFPGKWSSYPPHHHPQPEIYHYRFLPDNGFGFAMLGDDVLKVRHEDTVLILNDRSHPQVSAPGYAMYYIWVIRNLDGNPYTSPTFEPEHAWVQDPDAPIWPPER